jgi:hypothetical protein
MFIALSSMKDRVLQTASFRRWTKQLDEEKEKSGGVG